MSTKRMSVDAWIYWKNNHPDIISLMKQVDIKSNPSLLYKKLATKRALSENISVYNARFGTDLGAIFDWLDETCEQPYYVEFKDQAASGRGGLYSRTEFVFYFMDDVDAISFKMMFFDDDHR